jgi:hypothetical protein
MEATEKNMTDIDSVMKMAQEITDQTWFDAGMTQEQINFERSQYDFRSKLIDQHVCNNESFEHLIQQTEYLPVKRVEQKEDKTSVPLPLRKRDKTFHS